MCNAGARLAALEAELEALRAESAEHKDLWLRAAAELENFRRRAARELEDGRDRARAEVLRDVVAVLDDVDRALAAATEASLAGESPAESPTERPIVTGLRLIRARLAELLRRHGVVEIEAEGKAFDPHLHDGIMTLQAGELPDGTVVQVFERGYWLGERVLRPAKVAVARAEPA
jgi:molecular chaperone GrpE